MRSYKDCCMIKGHIFGENDKCSGRIWPSNSVNFCLKCPCFHPHFKIKTSNRKRSSKKERLYEQKKLIHGPSVPRRLGMYFLLNKNSRAEQVSKEVWHELEKIRFGVDCINVANSTPLDGCFFPKSMPIKERLIEILSDWPKEEIIEQLEFYGITVNWGIIDNILNNDGDQNGKKKSRKNDK